MYPQGALYAHIVQGGETRPHKCWETDAINSRLHGGLYRPWPSFDKMVLRRHDYNMLGRQLPGKAIMVLV